MSLYTRICSVVHTCTREHEATCYGSTCEKQTYTCTCSCTSTSIHTHCVCVCVCARASMCVCVCVRVCARRRRTSFCSVQISLSADERIFICTHNLVQLEQRLLCRTQDRQPVPTAGDLHPVSNDTRDIDQISVVWTRLMLLDVPPTPTTACIITHFNLSTEPGAEDRGRDKDRDRDKGQRQNLPHTQSPAHRMHAHRGLTTCEHTGLSGTRMRERGRARERVKEGETERESERARERESERARERKNACARAHARDL